MFVKTSPTPYIYRPMKPAKIALILSAICYVVSLALPTVATFGGFASLLSGPFGLMVDPLWGVVWLANLFYLVALLRAFISGHRPPLNWLVALVTVLLASISFFIPDIMVNEGGGSVEANLQSGFFVWLASFVILLGYHLLVKPKPPSELSPEDQLI